MDIRKCTGEELLTELRRRLEIADRVVDMLRQNGIDPDEEEKPRPKKVLEIKQRRPRGRPKGVETKLTKDLVLRFIARRGGRSISAAELLKDIQSKFHGVNSAMLQGHLRRLLEAHRIKKIGSDKPYRYFKPHKYLLS